VFKSILIFFILVIFSTSQVSAQSIEKYERYMALGVAKSDNHMIVILRKILFKGQVQYLTVDPYNLTTSIQSGDTLQIAEYPLEVIMERLSASPYVKALKDAEVNSASLQDAGITHFYPLQYGLDLTVDLCPSNRPLDRNFFNRLIDEFGKVEKPVPIAVAVTGIWMQQHDQDLQWLLSLAKNNILSITWINHSFNHKTGKGLPLKKNFLLEKGTDINFEILQTEKMMIEKGITPSVFFRFPGLVSDAGIFNQIIAYGLVPLGADAWLGKNQWPKEGSIVLVHANGNEPIGIERFIDLIKKERNSILEGKWLLLDLRESAVETESSGQ
jgi:hypothetical protein